MNQAFVIEPFNAVYCVFVGTVMALMAVLTGIIRKKDAETRKKIMVIFTSAVAVLLLFPAALRKKNDYLLSCCDYMGIISTLLAICMPRQGYAGYSLFKWHTFGFFLLHSLGGFIPVSVGVLGLYRPKYKGRCGSFDLYCVFFSAQFRSPGKRLVRICQLFFCDGS